MILLDTNICIHIHIINAKPPAVLQRFRHYRMGEIELCSVDMVDIPIAMVDIATAIRRHAF